MHGQSLKTKDQNPFSKTSSVRDFQNVCAAKWSGVLLV